MNQASNATDSDSQAGGRPRTNSDSLRTGGGRRGSKRVSYSSDRSANSPQQRRQPASGSNGRPSRSDLDEDVERLEQQQQQQQLRNSLYNHQQPPYDNDSNSLIRQYSLAPPDKYRLVCIGFTILGITTLLPWNFFITATDYWMYKFRKVDADYNANEPHTSERTPMQTFFESYLAIAANVPMLFAMLINSLYAQKISQKKRLYVSLTVMLIIFALTTIFVTIDTDHIQTLFFSSTMIMVVVISLFSATFQAAIFGIVANFPNNCMHAMVNGQAVAGLLAVTIQVLSMANNSGPITSGLWYFLASTVFLAFAILCYWLMDNDYSRYYLLRIPDEDELSTSLSVNLIESKHELLEALDDCWQMALSVVLAFWASLAVFPGLCVLVVPEHPNSSIFTGRFFVPITTFFLFNLGDLAGRLCASFITFPNHCKNSLLAATILRALIPLLIPFCNVVPRNNLPVLPNSDLLFPILVGLTALTNGYVFSSAMVMASENSRKTRLELTGFVMAGALGTGLTLGSVSSTVLLRII